ncbi:CheR family methyltransferase [Helicobacter sp. 13S00477-4]|uniref:CheR family methyltransferase n=1 Tax=Helicobacter sp. 13S00477-4 TaxID=1905759 RepID=UPI000BA63609|nr:CheR family methyltransferase [Helicobacter sp. 13S00477-4]PAF52421.1 SAM-dependent methyltransferase [Helicobacter sp. 13S00477-4]
MFFRKKESPVVCPKEEIIPLPEDDEGLLEFIEVIKKTSGVDLKPKQDVIKKRLAYFAQAHYIKTFKLLSEKVLADPFIRQEALNLITVNETYFYRELPQLEVALDFIKTFNKPIRILSAPCSSGEEVYSIGMLISCAGMNLDKIKIVGIDINSEAIDRSLKGIYSERSLHRLDNALKDKFFDKIDLGYAIKRHLLPESDFKRVNIFEDEFLDMGSFDIVFSRNMMIYFNETYRLKTVERFYKVLNMDGRMYTGHADLVPQTRLFEKKIFNKVAYYEKIQEI